MNYSLHPFPSQPHSFAELPCEPQPDIRKALASRPALHDAHAIRNIDLLDTIVDSLRDVSSPFYVTHCHESAGDLHLSVAAADFGYNVKLGDEIRGGLYFRNSESCRFDTLICTRLYRVVCDNGMLMECEKEQAFTVLAGDEAPIDWKPNIEQVIRRSFDEQALKLDFRRFEATGNQILVTPYEFLCHLSAQQVITNDEQSEIQSLFQNNADFTMYGLINAVTQSAHAYRASDEWVRAFQVERLAGEILRGDHNLPAMEPSFA